ncbi:hypothetical protein [Pseudofrankia inefficax]|uniref:Uncharacterized protein n=1 Tax=Pseudofrankia inefficax (strain DSM 45817 / CECT 9037 / DDB 130130 / EuI1c) TaxID=298654 RepID=E3J9P2_PSEI1|nr:hypothetical protein [Pseudofrankia inefficax]ADP84545.1 hypothetical protein FraEuI1c_6570 [Pseudofrankia inefficax]
MELPSAHVHLSDRQVAEQIMESIKERHGVDLYAIFSNDALSDRKKARLARVRLLEALLDEASQPDAGTVGLHAADFDEDTALARMLDTEVDIEPNLALTRGDATHVLSLRGDGVREYLLVLAKRFETMQTAKTPERLTIELAAAGLAGVGAPMTFEVIKELRAGQALTVAIRSAITTIGLTAAIAAVVAVLTGLLHYLSLDNPKKILGLVLNDTDEHLLVKGWKEGVDGKKDGDLYMASGHMAAFMQDNERGLLSPRVQVGARVSYGPDEPDTIVFAGIYVATRTIGLRGTTGVMIFSSPSIRVAHLFAVPPFDDNGTYIGCVNEGEDIEKIYQDFYAQRQVSVSRTERDYRLGANVNAAKGGVVSCIASIAR